MYFRKKTSGGRAYLQIAESQRVGGQVRQRVIATLGRLDVLAASGQLERLVRSGARFATQAMVLSAAQDDATASGPADRAGPGVRAPVGRDRLPGGDRGRWPGSASTASRWSGRSSSPCCTG